MPITAAQLAAGANYQLQAYAANDPIDQYNPLRPTFSWLLKNMEQTVGGNTYLNEKVRIQNDSNYQNYYGDDQVSYNRRDVIRLAQYPWYDFHDGFGLNEDELAANGITMTDDTNNVVTGAEKVQIVNLLKTDYNALKIGAQENFDLEMHRDGTQSSKACPGLDLLCSTTPLVGVVGGIDAAVSTYWRNNASMAVNTATAGTLTQQMELQWRACMTYGQIAPTYMPCGSAFLDAYRKEAQATIIRQAQTTGKAIAQLDVGTTDLYFHGVQLTWDPTFDRLDVLLGAITFPWAKRLYMLSEQAIKLKPITGRWMINRTPPRMYDRYVHYFGLTSSYRLTARQRNAMAVMSIA